MNKELKKFKKEIRTAIANYMSSEGCSCCRDIDGHDKHSEIIAKMLSVNKYKDGLGYDFTKYKTK